MPRTTRRRSSPNGIAERAGARLSAPIGSKSSVASDGSGSDETSRTVAASRIHACGCWSRRCAAGRPRAQCGASARSVARSSSSPDANTFIDVQRAQAHGAGGSPITATGVVCGRLVLTDRASGAKRATACTGATRHSEGRCEGRLGALLGANGAIYAIRRSEFSGINGDTIVDDLVIPLVMHLRTRLPHRLRPVGSRARGDGTVLDDGVSTSRAHWRRRISQLVARGRHRTAAARMARVLVHLAQAPALALPVLDARRPGDQRHARRRSVLSAPPCGAAPWLWPLGARLASPHPRLARGPALDHVHHDECGAPRWLLDVGQRHSRQASGNGPRGKPMAGGTHPFTLVVKRARGPGGSPPAPWHSKVHSAALCAARGPGDVDIRCRAYCLALRVSGPRLRAVLQSGV